MNSAQYRKTIDYIKNTINDSDFSPENKRSLISQFIDVEWNSSDALREIFRRGVKRHKLPTADDLLLFEYIPASSETVISIFFECIGEVYHWKKPRYTVNTVDKKISIDILTPLHEDYELLVILCTRFNIAITSTVNKLELSTTVYDVFPRSFSRDLINLTCSFLEGPDRRQLYMDSYTMGEFIVRLSGAAWSDTIPRGRDIDARIAKLTKFRDEITLLSDDIEYLKLLDNYLLYNKLAPTNSNHLEEDDKATLCLSLTGSGFLVLCVPSLQLILKPEFAVACANIIAANCSSYLDTAPGNYPGGCLHPYPANCTDSCGEYNNASGDVILCMAAIALGAFSIVLSIGSHINSRRKCAERNRRQAKLADIIQTIQDKYADFQGLGNRAFLKKALAEIKRLQSISQRFNELRQTREACYASLDSIKRELAELTESQNKIDKALFPDEKKAEELPDLERRESKTHSVSISDEKEVAALTMMASSGRLSWERKRISITVVPSMSLQQESTESKRSELKR